MSQFNTAKDVRTLAEAAAAQDVRKHKEHGVDLNPYYTQGARDSWQRGFDWKGARSYEYPDMPDWDFQYQRGAACARILKED